MPTSALGIVFYVFALFPGVAFIFAREGHRPAVKRSVLRETAALVIVSAICDAVIAAMIAVAALSWHDLHLRLDELLTGDLTWARENLTASVLIAIGTATGATLLGYGLGTQWADRHGLWRIWASAIPRDTSAWKKVFEAAPPDTLVQVAVTLKSGAWVSGTLWEFDNDPDPHPHRSLVLTYPKYRESEGEDPKPIDGADWLIVEAGDIEQLQVAYVATDDTIPVESEASMPRTALRHWMALLIGAIIFIGGVILEVNSIRVGTLIAIVGFITVAVVAILRRPQP